MSETSSKDLPGFAEKDYSSPFRTNNNQLKIAALFYERAWTDPTVLYTLRNEDVVCKDGRVIVALYPKYLEIGDPTEYEFARKYFESWDHWEMVSKSTLVAPAVEKWRRELELKLRSESLGRIIRESKSNSKNSFMANRYVLEKGWEPSKTTKGRPSKQDISNAAKAFVEESSQIENDYERIISKYN